MTIANEILIEEAKRLIDAAKEEGITLRLVGSIGFRMLCRNHRSLHADGFERDIGDIDLVGYKRDHDQIQLLFKEDGYKVDQQILIAGWGGRLVFYGSSDDLEYEVDVFFDKIDMCHELDLRDRLECGPHGYALNPSDLFFEKAQIVEINEKDLKDIATLFLEFPLTKDDSGINREYIPDLLSRDWGFYYTVTNNLSKVKRYAERTSVLSSAQADTIVERITDLETAIDTHEKSLRWKLRSLPGDRIRWYTKVDEKNR